MANYVHNQSEFYVGESYNVNFTEQGSFPSDKLVLVKRYHVRNLNE